MKAISEREQSRTELLRDASEDDIVTRLLKPTRLAHNTSLARRFGVWRTPIRELPRQLPAIWLIEVFAARKVFLARVELAQLLELSEAK